MSMLICKDVGCELMYCQSTIMDPYERPFNDCNEQIKHFNGCMLSEQRRYMYGDNKERTMQQQVLYRLQNKRNEDKYKNILEEIELKNKPLEEANSLNNISNTTSKYMMNNNSYKI